MFKRDILKAYIAAQISNVALGIEVLVQELVGLEPWYALIRPPELGASTRS